MPVPDRSHNIGLMRSLMTVTEIPGGVYYEISFNSDCPKLTKLAGISLMAVISKKALISSFDHTVIFCIK
jgi:hypothetical protein